MRKRTSVAAPLVALTALLAAWPSTGGAKALKPPRVTIVYAGNATGTYDDTETISPYACDADTATLHIQQSADVSFHTVYHFTGDRLPRLLRGKAAITGAGTSHTTGEDPGAAACGAPPPPSSQCPQSGSGSEPLKADGSKPVAYAVHPRGMTNIGIGLATDAGSCGMSGPRLVGLNAVVPLAKWVGRAEGFEPLKRPFTRHQTFAVKASQFQGPLALDCSHVFGDVVADSCTSTVGPTSRLKITITVTYPR